MSETLFLILQNTTCADGVYPFYHVCLILEKDRLNLIGTRTLLVIYLYLNAIFFVLTLQSLMCQVKMLEDMLKNFQNKTHIFLVVVHKFRSFFFPDKGS